MAAGSPDLYYLVHTRPKEPEGRPVLDDGSVLLCSFSHLVVAMAVASGQETLKIVRRSELSEKERRTVDRAFRWK